MKCGACLKCRHRYFEPDAVECRFVKAGKNSCIADKKQVVDAVAGFPVMIHFGGGQVIYMQAFAPGALVNERQVPKQQVFAAQLSPGIEITLPG
jgi:hypothetical protein